MSRLSKLLLLPVLIVFVLACNFVTQPIEDVQNLASTAESVASALPTDLPDLDQFNFLDPEGTPLAEWNGIPVMPQATAGEEFNEYTYSFKVNATVQEAVDYYRAELARLGWNSTFDLPVEGGGGLMLYSKESNLLTLTFTALDGETVVVLTLG